MTLRSLSWPAIVSQVNIQELMRNVHGLPDTTVIEPF
jgi:hypothetical protein